MDSNHHAAIERLKHNTAKRKAMSLTPRAVAVKRIVFDWRTVGTRNTDAPLSDAIALENMHGSIR